MPCLVGAIILLTYAIATSKYDTAAAVVAEPSNSFLLPPFLLATRSPAQGLSIDHLAAPAARLQGHDVEGRIQRVRGGFIGCEEEALGVRELLTREKRRLEDRPFQGASTALKLDK